MTNLTSIDLYWLLQKYEYEIILERTTHTKPFAESDRIFELLATGQAPPPPALKDDETEGREIGLLKGNLFLVG